MPSVSKAARIGAILGMLGAIILLISDIVLARIPASQSTILWPVTIPIALLILGLSVFASFRTLPLGWRIAFCCICVGGLLFQAFIDFVTSIFACFDVCASGSDIMQPWMLLGLGGLLLSIVGAIIILARSGRGLP